LIEAIEYVKDGVVLTLTGVITSKEILDAGDEIRNRDDFEMRKYNLWIFQSVEDIKISTEDIRKIAQQDIEASEVNPGIKVGVVSDSAHVFGLGRMYEAYAAKSQWETMIFYNLKDAQEWITSPPA
jgi:hypothetical protein